MLPKSTHLCVVSPVRIPGSLALSYPRLPMGCVLLAGSHQLGLCRAVPGGRRWTALNLLRMQNTEGCREMRLRVGLGDGVEHVGRLSFES